MNTIFDRCRLCLDPSVEISTTIDSPELKDQMEKVFCFSIEPKQGYCSGVCQSCSYTISEFYQYSEKVRQNQEILNGNATNCDQTKESKVSLECVKQEPLNDFGLPETIEDAHKPDNEVQEAEKHTILDSKISLECIKDEPLYDFGLSETIEDANEPNSEAWEAEEAPIQDSNISQENDKVQMTSDSEMMETNQDTCGPIDEVLEVEEKVPTLHSEITLEDFKIEIPDSDLPLDQTEAIDEEKEVPILDTNVTFESGKSKTPSKSELSKTAKQIKRKIQSQKEEDQFFKQHIPMVCDLCGKLAESYPALRSHFKKEHKRRKSYVVCCNKKLHSRCHIREHINFHANPNMFRCKVCEKAFKGQDALNIHTLKHHPQNCKCDHCPRSFADESALIEHMKLHKKSSKSNKLCTNKSFPNHIIKMHGEKEQDAHEPDSEASEAEEALTLDSKISQENHKAKTPSLSEIMETNQDALGLKDVISKVQEKVHTLHSKITLKDSKLEITDSGLPGTTYEAKDVPILDSEIIIETPNESEHSKTTDQTQTREEENELFKKHISLVCDLCGILVESYPAVDSHFKEEHKQRYSYVVCCNRKLFDRSQVREHLDLHANPDVFRCKVCGFRFKRRESLKVHMLKRHSQTLRCAHCPQTFIEEYALTKHMKLHLDNTKVQCPKCNKFCTKESLRPHMRRSHGEKNPKRKCDICGKEYYALNQHMKMHMRTQHATDEVQCDQCSKKFKHPRALHAHKQWWHTEPKHECEYCGQKFKLPYLLKEHRAIHTGEVLYTCECCGKSLSSRTNMVHHMQRHHPAAWEQKKLMKTKSIDPSDAGQPLKQ